MTNAENQLDQDAPQKMTFTGTGTEYFGIWIVNILLSILTLGIYSAWAKVRRNRYFYSNTYVAQGSFDYHGNPIAILKGRIAAVVLFALYNVTLHSHTLSYIGIMFLLMATVLPWLIWKSLQFKLYNSSYRGIRFGFRGSVGQAYFNFLLLPVLTVCTAYLLAPFTHQRIKKFQHSESRFGSTYFSFNAKAGQFYLAYLTGIAFTLAGLLVIGMIFGSDFRTFIEQSGHGKPDPAIAVSFMKALGLVYLWLILISPLFLTLIRNLIWNNTQLGEHRFESDLKWGKMTFILITNILGVICTLGLYAPFAHVRMLKYQIDSITLIPKGSLDNFIATTEEHMSATGEGVSDVFDFDLSL